MSDLSEMLREEFLSDKDYAHAYMESQIDAFIATQLKVLRDRAEWSQEQLAAEAGMKQERISVLEDVNYSSWTVNTLRKLARAFDLVLSVSFEEFGSEIKKIEEMDAEKLQRTKREVDLSRVAASEPIHTIERTAGTNVQDIEIIPGFDLKIRKADGTVSTITSKVAMQPNVHRGTYVY